MGAGGHQTGSCKGFIPDVVPGSAQYSFTELCETSPMNLDSIPRASDRRPMHLTVKSRVRSRVVFVDLLDLSEGGCKIRAKAGFAEVGDRVTMKVNGINTPLGSIAWVDGGLAGVAFEGAMHPAVIDYLFQQHEVQKSLPRFRRIV